MIATPSGVSETEVSTSDSSLLNLINSIYFASYFDLVALLFFSSGFRIFSNSGADIEYAIPYIGA